MNSSWSFTYPDLPVAQKRDLVIEAVNQHRVIIVEGGTGSGKSTQLPKILVEMGVLRKGLLGVTQPRRLAALALTDRLREETGIAALVGSQIRFHEDMPAQARIKVMTDGVLLGEYRRDPLLRRYDAIILDEAHERSLNIDILLGVGLDICKHRDDFKLIVASATLDAERFQKYFASVPGGAALLRVEGRQFPVSIEYLDPGEGWRDPEEDEDHADHAAGGLTPLEAAGTVIRDLILSRPDDLLCFLPSEKEINELSRELEKTLGDRCVVLPLYGRLSPVEQRRVYQSHSRPKVVLATNIAETSLTIPGIAYVVDTGTARIARYHPQTRIQGLPIEKIAQASAAQRSGRAGRVKPGLCIRLYSEEDFKTRPEWPEPEILRGNLTNVVLQLLSLRLPVIEFPFLDAPAPAALKGAYRRLQELGAVTGEGETMQLTDEGWRMSRLPVDAALAKILLSAEAMGTLPSAMVVAAGLTIQDPRFLPLDEPERGKAVGLHRRFDDARSDFIGLLKLWTWLQREWRDGISQKRLRKLCQDNYMSYLRAREWMDLVEQFSRLLPGQGDPTRIDLEKLNADALHKAILSGFLAYLARRRPNETTYRLSGDKEAVIHSGSGLSKRRPEWIVAGEIRQTSKAFIQRACEIQPTWVEEVAPDAVKRSYTDIAWNIERGFVEATERVSYRSFVLRQDRRIDFARIEPEACAEIFWREAVVRQSEAEPFAFIKHNQETLADLARHESMTRRRDLAPDEDALIAFYRQRAPEVHSRVTLRRFLESHPTHELGLKLSGSTYESEALRSRWQQQAEVLIPTRVPSGPALPKGNLEETHPLQRLFPETIKVGDCPVRVACRFDFGQELDGLSLEAPLALASQLTVGKLWQALPGWRIWILNSWLEKLAAKIADDMTPYEGVILTAWNKAMEAIDQDLSLSPALALNTALQQSGVPVVDQRPSWPTSWPPHLKLRIFFTATSGRRLLLTVDPGTCEAERGLMLADQVFGRDIGNQNWAVIRSQVTAAWGENPPSLRVGTLRLAPLPWPSTTKGTSPTGYAWRSDSPTLRLAEATLRVLTREAVPAMETWDNQGIFANGLQRRFDLVAGALRVSHDVTAVTRVWVEWLTQFWLPRRFAYEGYGDEVLARLEKEWRLPKSQLKAKATTKSFQDLQPLHSTAGSAESTAMWSLFLGAALLGPASLRQIYPRLENGLNMAPTSWTEAINRWVEIMRLPQGRDLITNPACLMGAAALAFPENLPLEFAASLPLDARSWQAEWTARIDKGDKPEKGEAEAVRQKLKQFGFLPQHWPAGFSEALDRYGASSSTSANSNSADASIRLKLLAWGCREGLKRMGRKVSAPEAAKAASQNAQSLQGLQTRFKKL